MSLTPWDVVRRRLDPPPAPHPTPGALARALWPDTVDTPALDLIDTALVETLRTPDSRLIITMPPQEGKSTRVARDFPLWVLQQQPATRIVTASYGQNLANRNGRLVRNTIAARPELGLRLAPDNGSVAEWQLEGPAGHQGGMLSVGIGAGVTGRPADLLVIDDPIKDRREADSPTFRQNVWDWWTDSASTRLAPGAPVVLILTRWHEDDLAGRLLAGPDGHRWRVLNIAALADHDPAKSETDPLGRQPGEFMASARGRSREQWDAIRIQVGPRTWAALYQGRPSPPEGGLFDRSLWRFYREPPWIERDDGSRIVVGFDEMLASWDMTFKDLDSSDYVVGQVWMRRGADFLLLDQTRARMGFVETLQAFLALSARWPQALGKLIEDKANGPAVINMLARRVPGIIAEEPHGSKEARAAAVSPLHAAGNLWLPDPMLCPWVSDLIEEAAAFPTGAHDDQVDAMSQALRRLAIQPLLDGRTVTDSDLDPDLDRQIAPY